MTVSEICNKCGLKLLVEADKSREIDSIYCCDLLSVVMSKAQENCAWVTIMNNLNSVAVASLIDMSCIVLAGGIEADSTLLMKATEQEINIIASDEPIFETALKIHNALKD